MKPEKIPYYKSVIRSQKRRKLMRATQKKAQVRKVNSKFHDPNFPYIVFFYNNRYVNDSRLFSTDDKPDQISEFLAHNICGKYKVTKNIKRHQYRSPYYVSIAFQEEGDFIMFMLLHGNNVRKIFHVVNEGEHNVA